MAAEFATIAMAAATTSVVSAIISYFAERKKRKRQGDQPKITVTLADGRILNMNDLTPEQLQNAINILSEKGQTKR